MCLPYTPLFKINHCPSHYYSTHSQSDISENEQFLRATVTK